MSKVTFSVVPTYAVKVRGEGGGNGICPRDDDQIMYKLLKWMIEKNIYPTPCNLGGHSGGGTYLNFFDHKEAKKVQKWLLENGAVEDDEKTWENRSG